MSRIYVKQVTVENTNFENAESLIDQAILKETDTKGEFKTMTSFCDEGMHFYTLVFERK
jgi:hypothetical protein